MKLIAGCLLVLYYLTSPLSEADTIKVHLPDPGTNASDTFPVPTNQKDMIFYVQRNHNINTIVYKLNYNTDNTINSNDPVHMYWIRYADGGEIKELSYLQKHYAYGIESELVDKDKKTFKLNFVSYKGRDIYLKRSAADNKYHAYINIKGKLSVLNKVFIQIEDGTFWVPHVRYVEISGHDILSKNPVTERFNP